MADQISELKLPSGLLRIFFRIPILMFSANLGWIMDYRFVLLIHTGRKTGRQYMTVLEIIRYDKKSSTCIVASGWGTKSDWFKNITNNPKIIYQIKNNRMDGIAERLPPDEASRELLNYADHHPVAFRILKFFMGYQLDNNDKDILALGKQLPMFVFKPASNERQSKPQ